MASPENFKYGSLIKYHLYNKLEGDKISNTNKNYWGVGYVVKIAKNYIKLSLIDPNKERIGFVFSSSKKIKLENILEFMEIPEPEDKKDKI